MVINPQKRDSVVRKNLKLFNMTATPQGDNRQFMSWNHFKASNEWLVASRWNSYKNVITQSTIEIKRNRTPNYSYRSRNSHIYVTAYLHRALIIPCVNFSIARCVGEFSPFPMCRLSATNALSPHGECRRFFSYRLTSPTPPSTKKKLIASEDFGNILLPRI